MAAIDASSLAALAAACSAQSALTWSSASSKWWREGNCTATLRCACCSESGSCQKLDAYCTGQYSIIFDAMVIEPCISFYRKHALKPKAISNK